MALFAGTGFNLFNGVSLSVLAGENAVRAAACSKELSAKESSVLKNVFRLSGGAIKVMELGHCLFGKRCFDCDRRPQYILTDEQGRAFPLRRYENSVCRFELFNCAGLAPSAADFALFDLRTLSAEERRACAGGGRAGGSYTAGLASSGVS